MIFCPQWHLYVHQKLGEAGDSFKPYIKTTYSLKCLMIFLRQQRNWCILESLRAQEPPPSTISKNKCALRSSGQSLSCSMNTGTGSIGHELTHLAARSFWEVLFHVHPFHTPISWSSPRGSAEPRASPCMEILPAWNSPVQGNKTFFNCRNFHQGPDLSSFQKQIEKRQENREFQVFSMTAFTFKIPT